MDDVDSSRYAALEFNAPMAPERVRELAATLRPLDGATIVDLGCGWGEFLLRVLHEAPSARGVGIDREPSLIARARSNADARALGDRVRFECADASAWSDGADAAIVIGSSHAWGSTAAALAAVRSKLPPGGRLLLGEGVWEQPPTPAALKGLGAEPGDFGTVGALVDLCVTSGFRPLALSTATMSEWDAFESGFAAGRERWLAEHPDAPVAEQVRRELDDHRNGWLHGYRGVLGFAYLTLIASP